MTKIVFLELVDSKPFQAVDENSNYWDIKYCKRDNSYYADNSGSGHGFYLERKSSVYWTKDKNAQVNHGNGDLISCTQRVELPKEFGEDIEEWAELSVFCEYCKDCDDWMPCDYLCEHLFFCDKCGYTHNVDYHQK